MMGSTLAFKNLSVMLTLVGVGVYAMHTHYPRAHVQPRWRKVRFSSAVIFFI